jgi:nucleoside 2-deoxyribosyltransferase
MAEDLPKNTKIDLYFAAPLFNAEETIFNSELANRLENKGYNVFLPQRDGFEFANLAKAFSTILQEKDIPLAVANTIFFFDFNKMLSSDYGIARVNEPMDPGVITEIGFAKMISLPMIGYRTDLRSPFGALNDFSGGGHFFPIFQCTKLLKHPKSPSQSNTEYLDSLADKLSQIISGCKKPEKETFSKYVSDILDSYDAIFEGVNIKSLKEPDELVKIANNYHTHKPFLEEVVCSF